uniref:Sulfotransferase n=1 Tax=Gopherus agassizii TaxID=38772 RepID=A0A452GPM1_9SAUR
MARQYFTHKGVLFPCLDYSPEKLSYVENEFLVQDDDVFNIAYPKSGRGERGCVCCSLGPNSPTWCWADSLALAPPGLAVQGPGTSGLAASVMNVKKLLEPRHHFNYKLKSGWRAGWCQLWSHRAALPCTVVYGSWFDHVTGWMGLKGNKNFFSITYEELQQDLQGSVRRICHFLGKELSEEQVAAVVENASFQSMKGNKMSNLSQLPDESMDHQKGEFLRKGICGDWRNHLSEAQNQRFDTVFRERMQGLGLTFPWD